MIEKTNILLIEERVLFTFLFQLLLNTFRAIGEAKLPNSQLSPETKIFSLIKIGKFNFKMISGMKMF